MFVAVDDHSNLSPDEFGMLQELHVLYLFFKDAAELLSLFPVHLGAGVKIKKGEAEASFRSRARDEHESALAKLVRSFVVAKSPSERSKIIKDVRSKR